MTPSPSPTGAPVPAQVAPSSRRVAIAQAAGYERSLVRRQVQALLDGIGGLRGVVASGDRVAIKVNLTGGTAIPPPAGLPAIETYITHPEVVRALGEALRDAGAREIFIVEAVYDADSFPLWGYDVAGALGATLVNLNLPQPYDDFVSVRVGEGWFIYETFTFNRILQEVDAFVSVAKMKCHCLAGVTHTMKNLIGLAPVQFYKRNPEDQYRTAFHGESGADTHLPRVIVDLNRARPIHLALIDGIKTVEGGEGPWNGALHPVQPGVLLAGRNAVMTDAVATAVMGFYPTADYPAAPFTRGENHMNLAARLGLGTNRLEKIAVVGASVDDVRYEFALCW
jgi:uncharacterized protein (DUF362 family)